MSNTPDILKRIVERKWRELAERKELVTLDELAERADAAGNPRGFAAAIRRRIDKRESAVIAEIKKASPSKGIIRHQFDPEALRPGGLLYVMEFAYPENRFIKYLYSFYFRHILPPVGNFIAKTPGSYDYLVESVDGFPSPENFTGELSFAGFREIEIFNLTFGIARIYRGVK